MARRFSQRAVAAVWAAAWVMAAGCSRSEEAPPPAPHCDVSTDEAAIAFAKAIDPKLGDTPCVQRSATFPDVITIGPLLPDRGCHYKHAIYRCALDPAGYPLHVMTEAGWGTGDQARRSQLALAWLVEIEHVQIVTAKPASWPATAPAFSPPITQPGARNSLSVAYWSADPAGMQPGTTYRHITMVFAADGLHISPKQIDTVEVR